VTTDNSPFDLLGPTAASRYLGVSRTTLHRLVEAGAIVPAQRTSSGYRRFSTRDLHRFLSMQSIPTAGTIETDDVLSDNFLRQSVLLDLAEQICGPHTVESMCMAAATVARDTLSSGDRAAVWMVDESEGSLVARASVGYPVNLDVSPFPIGRDSITSRALKTGQPIVCEDTMLRPLEGSNATRTRNADLRAFVAIPILGSRSALGLLLAGSRHPASFPAGDIGFLTRLTKLLSQSLETALDREQYERAYDTVQEVSDGLTECRTHTQLGSRAACALGRLSHADVVLISLEEAESNVPGAWIGAWSPTGLRLADLPPIPRDRILRKQLESERRTFRIEDIETYPGLGPESKRVGTVLGVPTWQVAPLSGPSGLKGAVSLGFKNQTQLSQSMLRSISVVALHLGLALSLLPQEATP
jgi:putative methionine-R-sulfoxide reductase with GAF domain